MTPSCTVDANRTMCALLHIGAPGDGTWTDKGQKYFAEPTERQYADDHIQLTVFRFVGTCDAVRVRSIRINADGTTSGLPTALQRRLIDARPTRQRRAA